tara:strand:- start:128 stop:673 length:546 start_codon:yes stop_codon:yes gene_type:complete
MENDKLKKLIRKAEVDNTMKQVKMGVFKGRREVHQNNPNFDLGRKPTNPNLNVEGVQKAGHPEAFELGLDSETMNNPEYQAILHQKRKTRALQSMNPKLNRVDTDDVSQEDIEAADKAARRRKRIGEAMEKQGMLFKTQAEPKTTTVVPAVVGKDRKKGTDKRSRENKKKFNPKNVGKEAY